MISLIRCEMPSLTLSLIDHSQDVRNFLNPLLHALADPFFDYPPTQYVRDLLNPMWDALAESTLTLSLIVLPHRMCVIPLIRCEMPSLTLSLTCNRTCVTPLIRCGMSLLTLSLIIHQHSMCVISLCNPGWCLDPLFHTGSGSAATASSIQLYYPFPPVWKFRVFESLVFCTTRLLYHLREIPINLYHTWW